jgi:hypothetical protein
MLQSSGVTRLLQSAMSYVTIFLIEWCHCCVKGGPHQPAFQTLTMSAVTDTLSPTTDPMVTIGLFLYSMNPSK